jgi:signal peptidase I
MAQVRESWGSSPLDHTLELPVPEEPDWPADGAVPAAPDVGDRGGSGRHSAGQDGEATGTRSRGQRGRDASGPLAGLRRQAARFFSGTGVRGRRRQRSLIAELPILVVVALAAALFLKAFVVQAFFIPSGSMQDTLQIGDKILVNKLVYRFRAIKPGDIVVFDGTGTWNANQPPAEANPNPFVRLYDDTLRPVVSGLAGLFGTPADQVDYVKRVIGVPGDHVVCCNAQGLVTVNGVPLHEQSYLYPGNSAGNSPLGIPGHFNVTVPRGYLWVLGDHRSISDDSRGHEADPGNGLVPERAAIGRAFVIVWPPSRWRMLPNPATFSQPGIDTAAGRAASPAAVARATEAVGGSASGLRSAPLRPEPSYFAVIAGFTVALPLTWLRRRSSGRRILGRQVRRKAARH